MNSTLDSFKAYLKAFATGPKGNRDLTYDESFQATKILLEGTLPPEVIGAFLMTWRVKIETNEELIGALDALKTGENLLKPQTDSIEIALPLEGKKKNIPLLLLSTQYLKNEHFVVTNSYAAKKEGATSLLDLQDICPKNVSIINRVDHLPKLEALQTLRNNLGQRSVFNTLEKLHHPLKSDYAVIGAHHGPYFKKYAKIFSRQYKRMMIVQGDEGCGEIIKKSKIEIIEKGEVIEAFSIDPKDFGIEFSKSEIALSLDEVKQELANPSQATKDLAKLNAAMYAYLKNSEKSIAQYYKEFEF